MSYLIGEFNTIPNLSKGKFIMKIIILFILALLLTCCGVKGDLYKSGKEEYKLDN